MILKLIAMIILGVLSALLSYYNKNYYVRVFNDILGREEDEKVSTRVGRGFFYGFFFPIYFGLLFAGLILLVMFLIAAGIIAAVVFVLVWVTEKILPSESLGEMLHDLFKKLGLSGPPQVEEPVADIPSAPSEDTKKPGE